MDYQKTYLDQQTLAKIKDMELLARRIIEGLVAGAHKSPYQGISVEFAEHREYVPGDDVRHIDWKVYGKTDKIYLKRYEQETTLICNLVLDCSQSMSYSSNGVSKLMYASRLAACLAYLVLSHQDSVGAAFFEDKVRYQLPPSSQPAHLKQIFHLLTVCQPSNFRSRIGPVLHEVADRLRKRSLIIVLSDFFDDLTGIVAGLKHLRFKRHEVVAFQVLDPAELDFPFQDITLFKGLESLPEVLAEPRGLRKAYLAEFNTFLRDLSVACRTTDVDYQRVRTDQALDQVLARYLAVRAGKGV